MYASGDHSFRSLAKTYGVSHTTIKNIVKSNARKDSVPSTPGMSHKPRPATPPDRAPATPPPPAPARKTSPAKEKTSLQLRRSKLREVAADIQLARARGSVHVLPQLHRLHVQLHDDMIELKKAEKEVKGEMSVQGLISSIVPTVSGLPPVVRHQILDHLEGLETGKLIRYPEGDTG